MANTLVTSTWVVNETAQRFMNSVKGVANFNRSYDDKYKVSGAKIGDTVLARLPQQFSVRRGSAYAAQPLYDRTAPISLTYQTGVDFDWSSVQGTLELDRIRERYVNPAADTLAADADAQGMADVYQSIYSCVGTPGATPATNLLWLQAKTKIFDLAGPDDGLVAVLDPLAEATLVNANATIFNPVAAISEQYKKGRFGRGNLGIGEWYRDQSIPRHVTGTFTASTPLVNVAGQTGSTINSNGWASGGTSLKKGDILTIAGVYSVNPISKVSTGRLQQFVLTADIADSSGDIALPLSPAVIPSGALQTVSASPAHQAVITVWAANPAGGTLATTSSPQSLLFHPDFAAFVMADLVEPEGGAKCSFARSKDFGISIRFIRQYDITTDQNGNRMDILFGAAPLQPRLACRVVG
jgi:hypothetical protein